MLDVDHGIGLKKKDDGVASASFLALMRTQDDAISQVATYLSLMDLRHVVSSCRTAMTSAFRQQVLRTTRLVLPPHEGVVRRIAKGIHPLVRSHVTDVSVVDTTYARLLQDVFAGMRSLQLSWSQYLTREEPVLDLSVLLAFKQLTTLVLADIPELEDITALGEMPWLERLDLSRTGVADISALASVPSLQELHLSSTGIPSISPLEHASRLHTLDLSYTRHLHALTALRTMPRLRKLLLNHKSTIDIESLVFVAGSLEHLEITDGNAQSVRLEDRERLVQALVQVTHLNLSWARFLPRLDAITGLQHLRRLILSGEKYLDLAPLAALPHLEALYIKQDVDVDLSVVGTLRGLRKLVLYGFRPHTKSVSFLGTLPHLEELDVCALFRLGLPTLPHLRRLSVTVLTYSDYFKYPSAPLLDHLEVCTRVDTVLLCRQFPYLKHLRLEEVNGISLEPLVQLKQLQSLEIGRRATQSQPIPDNHSFLRSLKALRHLHVLGTNLVDLFVLSGLVKLQELRLDGTQVRDVWHLTALPELETLSLADTKVRTVDDLITLPKLKTIVLPKLADCTPLTNAAHDGTGMTHLKRVLHPLQNCLWSQHRSGRVIQNPARS